MKFCIGILPLLLASSQTNVEAFVPVATRTISRQTTARNLVPIDPSNLQELPHHVQSLQDVMSTFSIADMDPAAAGDVAAAASTNNGWFGFLTGPTMAFLEFIHTVLNAVGLNSNSWGISIIFLTLTIKLLTFPLTKQQLESTQKMQVRAMLPFLELL